MNIKKIFDFSNKTIVITGASGLLGTQFSDALCQTGANVVLGDIKLADCKKLEKELHQKYDVNILSVKLDIRNLNSIKNMIRKSQKQFGTIDGLVNNAVFPEGIKERSIKFEDFPVSLLKKGIETNTIGTFLCCQQVGKIMKSSKNGVIVNINSIYGLVPPDQRIYGNSGLNSSILYNITKSSLLNFTRYLAAYWGSSEIRVNSLTLGGVFNHQKLNFVKKYSSKTMLGRMAKKNDYVGALLFLLSDSSSYMTGSNVVIDGGWTSW
jgi:NAD(P)-dependent dehydrogenase (short-subunit alcohol dehydrogenase family)